MIWDPCFFIPGTNTNQSHLLETLHVVLYCFVHSIPRSIVLIQCQNITNHLFLFLVQSTIVGYFYQKNSRHTFDVVRQFPMKILGMGVSILPFV